MCVCVDICVCVSERDGEREREGERCSVDYHLVWKVVKYFFYNEKRKN